MTSTEPLPAVEAGPRIDWVELGRVAAIVAVILVHIASPLVLRPAQPTSWWFGNLVESASRWCVPVFVMISGALLLASPRTTDAVPFYRRRFARLGPAMIVWTIAYLVFGYLVDGVPRTLEEAYRSVLAGRPYFHLYFLFIIAGLYVVAPGLRWMVERLDRRGLALAAAIMLMVAASDSIISVWFSIGSPNAVTRWLPFVGFFLAGLLVRDLPPSPRRIRLAAVVAVVGILATALGTALLVGPLGQGLGRGRYMYEYPSITTIPVSLAVFALIVWLGPGLMRRSSGRGRALVASAAAASFGIYLLHPMVLTGLSRLGINARATSAPIAFTITLGLTFTITWALIAVMRRVPGLRVIV